MTEAAEVTARGIGRTPRTEAGAIRGVRADLIGLAVVWLIAVCLTNPIGNFPLNDDWVYGLAVKSILEKGTFSLPSPASANVFLQAYWGALFCLPFGFSFTALRFSTLTIALAGLLASYMLVRDLGGSRRTAVVSALAVGLNPLYFVLANTFMTDVPFVALITVSFWLFVRGIVRDRGWLIASAFGLALACVLIRQFAVIYIGGYGAAYVVRYGLNRRSLMVLILPLLSGLIMHIAFQRWLTSTGRTPMLFIGSLGDLRPYSTIAGVLNGLFSTRLLPYLGLLTAPILALWIDGSASRGPRQRPSISPFVFWSIAVVLLLLIGYKMPSYQNILTSYGFGPLTLRDTQLLGVNVPQVPIAFEGFWIGIAVVSVLAASATLFALATAAEQCLLLVLQPRRWQEVWLQSLVVLIASGLGLVILVLSLRQGAFDRYVLMLLPVVTALLAPLRAAKTMPQDQKKGWALLASLALLSVYGAFSVAGTRDYLTWNRMRWAATDGLERTNVRPNQIDGGYEYNGWKLYDPRYVSSRAKSYWWVVDDEFIIASGQLPGYVVVRRLPFRRWLFNSDGQVVVLRRSQQIGTAASQGPN